MEEQNITRITHGDKEIIIVGTAHVSFESVALVEKTILEEKPSTVCVELCLPRYEAITKPEAWQQTDIVKVIRENKTPLLLAQLIMAAIQKKIASKLNIAPGAEMLKAIEVANGINAKVELVDREIRITILRAWRGLSFWGKVRILSQATLSAFATTAEITAQEIENLKKSDMLEAALRDIGNEYPQLKRSIIDERDLFLAHKITTSAGKKVVAVLGAGHVPGVLANIGKSANIAELNTIPPEGFFSRYSGWILLALICGLFIGGFFYGGTAVGLAMIGWWSLITASCGALGAIIMLAHPLTIIATALSAPIATLHPFIATGWVAGLVEALLRKPQVKDFVQIREDISSFRGFFKNKVTRILILIAFVNITASVGTITAIPIVTGLFLKG